MFGTVAKSLTLKTTRMDLTLGVTVCKYGLGQLWGLSKSPAYFILVTLETISYVFYVFICLSPYRFACLCFSFCHIFCPPVSHTVISYIRCNNLLQLAALRILEALRSFRSPKIPARLEWPASFPFPENTSQCEFYVNFINRGFIKGQTTIQQIAHNEYIS